MKRLICVFLTVVFFVGMFGSCTKTGTTNLSSDDHSAVSSDLVNVSVIQSNSSMFTDRDREPAYEENSGILIQLNGDSATASSNSVKISGSTITITEEATYIISGSLDDGMILVDASDTAKLQVVLNGVSIHSETSAPLYIREADKVFVTLADGTENTLSNGGTFSPIDENNIDAVIFSKQDLTLNGFGSLTINSPAGHGIVSKDDLVITGGEYTISSASHGLDANDSIRVEGATMAIDAGKDGIHAENNDDTSLGFVYISSGTIDIESEGDGISAGTYVQIENGTIDVLAGGGYKNGSNQHSDTWGGFMGGRPGEMVASKTTDDSSTSMKGIKASEKLLVFNGNITVDSADDSIHSNGNVIVSGGAFSLASGDDAIHAEETLTITAGTIDITQSYEGLEALNIEVQGGDIKLVASDDGLNAAGGVDSSGMTGGRDGMFGGPGGMGGGMSASSNGSIVISGGNLYINASGDGLDANGTLEISGGYTVVVGPTQGDTATLDYDTSATITGGTFIGTGASGMAQTFSDSKQGVIAVSVGNQPAGTAIHLQDKNGNTILSYEPELSFAVVILSSPEMVIGDTYTITVGASSSEFEAT